MIMTGFRKFPLFEGDDGAGNAGNANGAGGGPPSDAAENSGVAVVQGVSPSSSFLDTVPESYRDKSYTQAISNDANPQEALWKHLDGLEAAMGQRPGGMPESTADEAAKKAWAELIAPENIAAYGDVKPTLAENQTHLQEIMDASYNPETINNVLEAFRQVGVQDWQMKAGLDVFNKGQVAMAETFFQQQQQQYSEMQQDFETKFTQEFGNDKDQVLQTGKQFIKDHLPVSLKPFLDTVPNDALLILAGFANTVKTKYGKEDGIPNGSSTSVATDETSLRAQIEATACEPAFKDKFSPGHKAAYDRFVHLNAQLSKITRPNERY